jgi:hypothetical protein
VSDIIGYTSSIKLSEWLQESRNARALPVRLEECGYTKIRNPDRPSDGLWLVGAVKANKQRKVIFALKTLSIQDQIAAARERGERD